MLIHTFCVRQSVTLLTFSHLGNLPRDQRLKALAAGFTDVFALITDF